MLRSLVIVAAITVGIAKRFDRVSDGKVTPKEVSDLNEITDLLNVIKNELYWRSLYKFC